MPLKCDVCLKLDNISFIPHCCLVAVEDHGKMPTVLIEPAKLAERRFITFTPNSRVGDRAYDGNGGRNRTYVALVMSQSRDENP